MTLKAAASTLVADHDLFYLSFVSLHPHPQFKSEEKIALIDADLPVLVAHATQDKVVPFAHGRRIFEAFGGPSDDRKSAVFLESDRHTLHNATDAASAPFFAAVDAFIQDVTDENKVTSFSLSSTSAPLPLGFRY